VEFLHDFSKVVLATGRDVLPIILLIVGFQLLVLRQPVPHLRRLIVGGIYVVIGLALFLAGLEKALFPLGKIMAAQLSDPVFIYGAGEVAAIADWQAYGWIYLFAAMIGFATTIAEPSLIAVAYKANEVSAGTISQWGLRITVALGVAFGISLGTFRIVTGTPLYLYILNGYMIVLPLAFVEILHPFHHHSHETADGRRGVKQVRDPLGVTEMTAGHPQKRVHRFLLPELPVAGVDDFTFFEKNHSPSFLKGNVYSPCFPGCVNQLEEINRCYLGKFPGHS
jgi:hypothetical protein